MVCWYTLKTSCICYREPGRIDLRLSQTAPASLVMFYEKKKFWLQGHRVVGTLGGIKF